MQNCDVRHILQFLLRFKATLSFQIEITFFSEQHTFKKFKLCKSVCMNLDLRSYAESG